MKKENREWKILFANSVRLKFQQKKLKNPRYSLRSFAKQLNVSIATASFLVNDSKVGWDISKSRALLILQKMNLPKTELNLVLIAMGEPASIEWTQSSADSTILLENPVALWVLHSVELETGKANRESVAKYLNLPISVVDEAIAQLLSLKIITKSGNGTILKNNKWIEFGDGPSNNLVQIFHRNSLSQAAIALIAPSEHRHYATTTFIGDRDKIKEAREEIRKCMDRVATIMQSDSNGSREVYRISVQLFPGSHAFEGTFTELEAE